MKHKFYHSLLAGLAMLTATVACSPDNEVLPVPDLTPADLVEGKAYRVTVDQTTNKVTMTSLLGSGYITSWTHPQGLERGESAEANIPFAGDYEIKFGVMTRGGMVYGEPYRFTLNTTNGDLLTDPLWTYLTGGADQSKTWVLDHNNLDMGSFTFMCHYMGWDKFTEGKTFTEADCPDYKDEYGYDSPDWSWQAGEPDWMFTADQYESIPELTFDLINGANLTVDGVSKAFVMDPTRKTITMPEGLNWLGTMLPDGYLADMVNLELVKLNEHVLGLKVVREDGLGGKNQRMVMCYVEKGWDGSWPVTGPALTTKPVQLPTYDNLLDDLFTVVTDDATYLGSANNFLLNEDRPYGFMEWDGTGEGKWSWIDNYATITCPAYDGASDFLLNIAKSASTDGDGKDITVYTATRDNEEGQQKVTFTVSGNKIIFDKPMTLFSAGQNTITGTEYTVLTCDPEGESLIIGVPASYDETGTANRYLCANLTVKSIGGGATGPTVIAVDHSVFENYIDTSNKNAFRIDFYNPWGGEKAWPIDITKVKLKNGQTLKIAFKINGVTWKNAPRVLFSHNVNTDIWPSNDGSGYNDPTAVTLNTSGETIVTFTNNTGSVVKFEGSSCMAICVDQQGNTDSPLDAAGDLDLSAISVEITSMTIE